MGVHCDVVYLLLQRRNRKFISLKVPLVLLRKAVRKHSTALGNGRVEVVGAELIGYATEGRSWVCGLEFVFVGQPYDEILINLED